MTTSTYLTGRKRYQRPQAILWSENSGTLSGGLYIPNGYEVGADTGVETDTSLFNQFLILSDHNRSEINISTQRIESRKRTINGRMRSYHIADKLGFSFSWTNLPSRAYNTKAMFESSGLSDLKGSTNEYTADGGAGGVEVLDWYNNHQGPFWMFLSYDKYSNFGKDAEDFNHLNQYNEIVQVYFSNLDYSIVKRGGSNHDLWNISVSLEEV